MENNFQPPPATDQSYNPPMRQDTPMDQPQQPLAPSPHRYEPPKQSDFYERKAPSKIPAKIEQIILLLYFFLAIVLISRFGLSLLGAHREVVFVDFVYQLTTPFMFPFEGMFGGPVGSGGFKIEFEIIVALIIYGLVFFGISRLVKILFK